MREDPAASQIVLDEEADLPCPQCGYDLRAAANDQCPECGFVVDRARLVPSRIPWVHRHSLGFVRAYWRTLRFALFSPATLGAEARRPPDRAGAESFRWITVVLATLGPAAALAVVLPWNEHLILRAAAQAGLQRTGTLDWQGDFTMPWAAGLTLRPTPPVAIFITLALMTGVTKFWFRPRRLPPARREAAVAVSRYGGAALTTLWAPTLAAVAMGVLVLSGYADKHPNSPLIVIATLATTFGLAFALLMFAASNLSIHRAATRAGRGRAALAFLTLPIAWYACALVGLGLVPWLIGLVRLVFASLR